MSTRRLSFWQRPPARATDVSPSVWHQASQDMGVSAQTGRVPGKPGPLGHPMASKRAVVSRGSPPSEGVSLGLRDTALCSQVAAQRQGPRRAQRQALQPLGAGSAENLLWLVATSPVSLKY